MRTLHLSLRVADRDRSLAFYTAVGYEIVGRVPETPLGDLTMLKLPGDEFVSVELVHDPSREGAGAALSHLVVQVESMDATLAGLSARGVDVEVPTSPDGSPDFRTTWIVDPDGNRIELVQWPVGHVDGMTATDFPDTTPVGAPPRTPRPVTSGRRGKSVVEERFRRQQAGDESALDELVAADMVNHAAGPQGRDGLKRILRTIDDDLGPVTVEQHHVVGEGDLVVQHLTLHGTHRASTMPLLAKTPASGRRVAWTFIHIWRVVDGVIVEHWACRDDMGLLDQIHD
jgi:lactoylglutathione lyase